MLRAPPAQSTCTRSWMWRSGVATLLLAAPGARGWPGTRTADVPPQGEGGAVWNAVPLDCTGGGGPITILQATYGLPLQGKQPGDPKCEEPVPIGNLNKAAAADCVEKEKCTVTSCPCTEGNTCPPGAKCDAGWVDPRKGCMKGMTVVYRCGDAQWGWPLIALLLVGAAAYGGGGVLFAQRVQGRKPAGPGAKAALQIHPHAARWREVWALVEDGIAHARGGGGAGRPQRRQGGDEEAPPDSTEGEGASPRKERREKRQKKERGSRKGSKDSRSASAKEPLLEPSPAPAPGPPPPEAAEKKGGGSGYRGDEWAPPKAQLQSGARETGVKVKY